MQKLVFAVLLTLPGLLAFSQDETVRKKHFNTEQGLAISGYDPVTYFTGNKAVKGSKENSVSDQGIVYYFSSAANKEEFKKNPSKYEPQYGGWCAYAMGKDGTKVEVDPGTFKIVDGKLFLFYNHFFTNTLKTWNKDEPKLNKQADSNWKKFVKTNP
jgi:YHS domain-containing protein